MPGGTTLALASRRGTVSSDSRNLRGVVIGCYMGTSEHTFTEQITYSPIKRFIIFCSESLNSKTVPWRRGYVCQLRSSGICLLARGGEGTSASEQLVKKDLITGTIEYPRFPAPGNELLYLDSECCAQLIWSM